MSDGFSCPTTTNNSLSEHIDTSELNVFQLDELADIVDCEHKTAQIVDNSEFYSIRTSNILNGKIDFHNSNRISFQTYTEWTKRAIPKDGDIILAREAPVGEVGMIKKGYKTCLGQRTVLLSVKDARLNNYYLLYYLVNPIIKFELIARSTGSVVSHLNMKDIRAFEINIPPLPEQKAIATVLSSLDDKIDLLHRQNKTLEAMAETLFRQWFIEEAKEDWEESLLKNIVHHLKPGTNHQPKRIEFGIPFLNVRNLKNGFLDLSDVSYISDEEYRRVHKNWQPEINDVLISRIGTLGIVAMIEGRDIPLAVHYNMINVKAKLTTPQFLYFLFKSSYFQDLYALNIRQSVQEYVAIEDIENIKLKLPINKTDFLEKQDYFNKFHKKISNNESQIRVLEKLRDNLLPKLMSGEVRVSYEQQDAA